METFGFAFLIFAVVVAAMAIGVIFGNRSIKGSCGGLAAWKDAEGNSICEACADCPDRKKECELENSGAEKARSRGVPVRGLSGGRK